MDLNELKDYYQGQYDDLESVRILKEKDLKREEQKQSIDDELIFKNNDLDDMLRRYKKNLVVYMKLKEKYYNDYPLKANEQNAKRMKEFKRQQRLIEDYDNTVKKIENANKETQRAWNEKNKDVKAEYDKAIKKWEDENKLVKDKVAKARAQINIDKEAAEELGTYQVPEPLTSKVRYVNLSFTTDPQKAGAYWAAQICASQLAVYSTDDINKNIAAGKPVITEDTKSGGEETSVEVQKSTKWMWKKYSKNKTFSFYKKGGNSEGGVTVNGGKDGFNNAYDMATAFQQHKNYSELPYTVSAIGDPTKPGKTSIVITFKNHGSQEIRRIQNGGHLVVEKKGQGPELYPYKGQSKGFGSAQGLTNNELELKTGGLIHNVEHVWQNTAKSNEYKKKYSSLDEFAKSFYYVSQYDLDNASLGNPNTTRAFPYLEREGIRKTLLTKGKMTWPREQRWRTQFVEIDLGEPTEIYKVVWYGISGRDKDDGLNRSSNLFNAKSVMATCMPQIYSIKLFDENRYPVNADTRLTGFGDKAKTNSVVTRIFNIPTDEQLSQMSETSERPTMSSMGKAKLQAVPDRSDVPLVAELPTFKTPNRDLLLKIKKIQNQLIGLAINIHKQYEDHQQHQQQYNYFAHYKVRDTLLMKQTAALVEEREYVDDAINSFMLRSNEHKESNRRAVSNRLTMMFWSFITFTVITCFLVIAFAPSFSGLIIPFIFGSAVISALAILTSYAGNVAAFTIWMIIIFAALYLILSI